ncbi:MAG: carboxypeptidase regulatory-like domain-containing protein [Acidobacteria bacterium]|nr:carboxypeptidase regulatory-like domain-containing protein [Acidobacteriota bacterium]
MRKFTLLFAIGMLCGVVLTAQAQTSTTATITGIITDTSGAVIAGADIELLDESTNQTQKLVTDAAGRYDFSKVLPGEYKLTAKSSGFRQSVVSALKIEIAKSYTVNLTLEVGSVSEIVQITTSVAVGLQRSDATVGAVIGGEQLLRLPSINRGAATLLSLQPLVQPTRGNLLVTSGQVAGARSEQSTFNLDGADATDLVTGTNGLIGGPGAIDHQGPSPMIPVPAESIEEFRVSTTNPNATFGRSAGGQVSMVTKRGTNQLHGSAYWYHQNDNLNANRWQANRLGIKQPELKDNRFGVSLGGPLWRDKTFLFGHYEGRRFPQSAIVARLVPTASLKQGILRFRDAAGTINSFDLKTFDPRTLGVSPVIQAFWNKFPAGNDSTLGDGLNTTGFAGPTDATRRMDFAVARLDHFINEKWNFNATYRYARQRFNEPGQVDFAGILPGNTSGKIATLSAIPVEPRYASARLTGQLTPTLINEFVFGYARNWYALKRQKPIPQIAGTTGALLVASGTLSQGFDAETINARDRIWNDRVWQYGDNLTWVKRNHNVQFGGTWRRMPVVQERTDKSALGSLTSLVYELNARTATSVPAANRPATCGSGVTTNCLQTGDVARWNDLYTGALGIVDRAGILAMRDSQLNLLPLNTPIQIDSQYHSLEFYGNDVWRLRNNLTLTAGLTYALQTAPVDKNGRQSFIIDTATKQIITSKDYLEQRRQAALQGNVYNPTLGWLPIRESGRDRIYPTDKNNFGPRLSAAWTPNFRADWLRKLTGEQKTVLRGGYSVTYDRINATAIIALPIFGVAFVQTSACEGPRRDGTCVLGSNPTNAFRIGVDGTTVPLPIVSQGTSPVIPGGSAVPGSNTSAETLQFSIDPDLTHGYSHSIDFTIQRELPGNFLVEVGYAGRLSRNLQQTIQLNSVPLFMKDSASGQSFAQAYDAVATALRTGQSPAAQPWFENQFRGATFCGTGACTAALVAAQGGNFQIGAVNTLFNFLNTRRPAGPIINRQVTNISVRTNGGLSNYHALFATVTKRFSSGMSFTANYTLSRALDQLGVNQELFGSGGSSNSNGFDLNLDYGPALFDRTHVFNSLFSYELPIGKGKRWNVGNTVLNRIVGGWYLSGIYTANSGLPLSVGQHAQAFGGDPNDFAIVSGAIPKGKLDFGNAVNASAGVNGVGTNAGGSGPGLNYFANPEAAYNSFRPILLSQDTRHGRGVLRGFPRWNLDLSIGKKTQITERLKTVFSFDMINALNRVEFNDPGMDLRNRGAFGVITSQFASPRQIQLGLRLEF